MATAPQPGRRGFVVLITDGVQSSAPCAGNARIVEIISTLFQHGYATYVVGFGTGVSPSSLDSFAEAGGVPLTGMPHKYYQANDAAQLEMAINAIAGRIGGDEFACAGTPCP